MKLKFICLSLIIASLTTGCFFSGGSSNNNYLKADGNVYSMVDVTSSTTNYSQIKSGTVNYCYKNNEELIPFVSLKQFEKIYHSQFVSGVSSKVSSYQSTSTWQVSTQEGLVFASQIDYARKEIYMAGSLSAAIRGYDYSGTTLEYALTSDYEILKTIKNYQVFSYANMGFSQYMNDDVYYLPLSIYDINYSKSSGLYVYYSYKDFYVFDDSQSLSDVSLKKGSTNISPFGEAKQIADTHEIMPEYLRKYNQSSLYFIFENFYGIKSTRGISSMKSYIDGQHLDFLSESSDARSRALSQLVSNLNDGHTAIGNPATVWSETKYPNTGELATKIAQIYSEVGNYRRIALSNYDYNHPEEASASSDPTNKRVRYSDDKKLAFFCFDSFDICMDAYTSDGKIKSDAYLEDSFLYFLHQFNEISKYPSVEDVVIDISMNGGGYLTSLAKVLVLLTVDNKGIIDEYVEGKYVIRNVFSVDSNQDGKYNEQDVYGSKYNFYILTSGYSYSCGNALPCLAQRQGIAKVIGETSGGGECSVDGSLLPNGQFLHHSSLTHIISYENNSIHGVEQGCDVASSHQILHSAYYDFNYLEDFIKTI